MKNLMQFYIFLRIFKLKQSFNILYILKIALKMCFFFPYTVFDTIQFYSMSTKTY